MYSSLKMYWFFLILFNTLTLHGASNGETVPFVVKTKKSVKLKSSEIRSLMQNSNSDEPINAELEEENLVQIPIETLKSAIDSIKSKLCSTVGENGTIRFWLKAGAKAEIFGIGGSSESGIEVTVNCKK